PCPAPQARLTQPWHTLNNALDSTPWAEASRDRVTSWPPPAPPSEGSSATGPGTSAAAGSSPVRRGVPAGADMSQPASTRVCALPRWLVALGSVALAGPLRAVRGLARAAPSGPWATPFDPSTAPPPQFAQLVDGLATPTYLRLLKMTHNYHFAANRPGPP